MPRIKKKSDTILISVFINSLTDLTHSAKGNKSSTQMCQPSRTNSVYDLFESVYWSPDAITASIRNALYGAACYETRDEDTITVASDTLQPDDYIIKDLPMHDVPEIIVVPVMPAMPSHLHRPQQLIPLKANKSEKSNQLFQ